MHMFLFKLSSFYFWFCRTPVNSFFFLCVSECPDNYYGEGCSNICSCNKQNTQLCNKTSGVCMCKQGWTNTTCDTDVDECQSGSGTCPVNSICSNLPGSYLCTCNTGFLKSGEACVGKKLIFFKVFKISDHVKKIQITYFFSTLL